MSLYQRLEQAPYRFDFYQTLRRFDSLSPHLPRLGDAARPADEAVRLGQEPSLTFAPANLSRFVVPAEGPPRMTVRFLGLFGPQGALPLHLTELARERERTHGDPTLTRFVDLFHHRLLSMFYKAWRQAQPTVSHDRPAADRFAAYQGSLIGLGGVALAGAGATGAGAAGAGPALAGARRFFAGHLGQGRRNAEGLVAILSGYFKVPVTLVPFCARWMPLPPDQRSSLGPGRANALGRDVVLGARVWDAQHHIGLRIGPLTLDQYRRLLPGQPSLAALREWVAFYTDRQLGCSVNLVLQRDQVPALRLGAGQQLGLSSWLGRDRRAGDRPADQLTLGPDALPASGPA